MSHIAVLVIGKNVEKQLRKYDENIEVKRYVKYNKEELINQGRKHIEDYKNGIYAKFLKDPEKYKAECKNNGHLNYVENEFPKKLDWTDEQVYADEIKGYESGDVGKKGEVYSTYNPRSRWDWYEIGGRWRDTFPIKDGCVGIKNRRLEQFAGSLYRKSESGYADSAMKGDIDWAKIHQSKKAYDKAIRFWEMKVNGDKPTTKQEKTELNWDMHKDEYYLDRYKTKENYARCQSNFAMWAVVKRGKWYEKGSMGMFGCADETHDEAVDWELNFYDHFIKDLPDDTVLTVVDCHI